MSPQVRIGASAAIAAASSSWFSAVSAPSGA
jgi:hypothetical protein